MCTINSDTEVMVCDVSRDFVREEIAAVLGEAFTSETVHGEGTRFTCLDATDSARFLEALQRGQMRAG